ncbi:GNAT family N-acetyltransferase [Nesterenkonia ebinurensis]|uniref:GNAT family N-acetyltransferase n=1 Tax=Nesterenkonia ebinurensis TaxID=2608252 RepID=UPI00123E0B45|nr:GNAT family N-acetyltransferase [Nesterenkonia ebinurensis]
MFEIVTFAKNRSEDLQSALSSWFPSATHPGGFAWELATDQLPAEIRVALRKGAVVGWAAFSSDEVRLECAPDEAEAPVLLLDWLLETAGEDPFILVSFADRPLVHRALASSGFAPAPEATPPAGLFHSAVDAQPAIPKGYRIRPMGTGEVPARVEAHRRAWKPVNMSYPADQLQAIDPDAESRFTLDVLRQMQQLRLYDQELDLVVEAPNGSLAGCCTVWLDPVSGWAEIEPLGIVPEHRRKSLAQVLVLEACGLVARRGGRQVFINSAPWPNYSAPWHAYLRAGFTPMERGIQMSNAVR